MGQYEDIVARLSHLQLWVEASYKALNKKLDIIAGVVTIDATKAEELRAKLDASEKQLQAAINAAVAEFTLPPPKP